jgi:hypothetical protein
MRGASRVVDPGGGCELHVGRNHVHIIDQRGERFGMKPRGFEIDA